MGLIDVDALNDTMYYEAFENDDSYDERNPMARWDSGLWIRYKKIQPMIDKYYYGGNKYLTEQTDVTDINVGKNEEQMESTATANHFYGREGESR